MATDTSKSGEKPKTTLKSLKPLIPFALRHKGRILAGVLALAAASAATLLIPVAVRRVVDSASRRRTPI
jgi:ATP-binding cassette, subfamily B, bacterial